MQRLLVAGGCGSNSSGSSLKEISERSLEVAASEL